MFGLESVAGPFGAALLIGVVLVEALLLYVGYGLLESALGPTIARAIRGD
ncbi:DUF7512 family protein [Halobellus rubicundus]|uniref:Uncharacterized protein n=1 Tax=Halobellus rubicundus TaxID=2996466 RepID=A0ABD5MHL7_9EURY